MLCAKLTSNMSHQQWRVDYVEACSGLLAAPD
jgi:hypothetical protein